MIAKPDGAWAGLVVVKKQSAALHLAPGQVDDFREQAASQQEKVDDRGMQRLCGGPAGKHFAKAADLLVGKKLLAHPMLVGPDAARAVVQTTAAEGHELVDCRRVYRWARDGTKLPIATATGNDRIS